MTWSPNHRVFSAPDEPAPSRAEWARILRQLLHLRRCARRLKGDYVPPHRRGLTLAAVRDHVAPEVSDEDGRRVIAAPARGTVAVRLRLRRFFRRQP